MENFLTITTLNDFVFCPYSIYLHEVYNPNKEEVYHGKDQSKGKRLHYFIENNQEVKDFKHAYVISTDLKIYGKIDDYNCLQKELIEYKSKASTVYKGYYYQIWAQYYCLKEMGIQVNKLAFYDFSKGSKISLPLPTHYNLLELKNHIIKVQNFDFTSEIKINPNKCNRCVYKNLCEKNSN